MKNTGIVRKVDELGRIVLPREIREKLGINPKSKISFYIEQNKIVIKKSN